MTDLQSSDPPAASMRRRDALLGLFAFQLRRSSAALGLFFSTVTGNRASANVIGATPCEPLAVAEASWAQQRRARVAHALQAGFGVQYWGKSFTAKDLAAAPHGFFIIETAKIGANANEKSREVFFTPDEVRQIGHNSKRPVLGYLNLGKIEHYRDYWVDANGQANLRDTIINSAAPWVGPTIGQDGTLARFWTPEWAAILSDRVDRLMRQGIDGLFLDDVLQYYAYYSALDQGRPGFSTAGGPVSATDFARAMMALVVQIANRARQHDCQALIVVNSGIYIGRDAGPDQPHSQLPASFAQYRLAIDGVLIESVFASGGDDPAILVLHEEFASQGIPILTVDFADTAKEPFAEFRTKTALRAISEGFAPYIADDAAFDRLYAPIPINKADLAVP